MKCVIIFNYQLDGTTRFVDFFSEYWSIGDLFNAHLHS
jgi:hypothetical protein